MARNKVFTPNAWEDYLYWQAHDKQMLKKVNKLIDDICRNGYEGIGKPEPLSGDLSGFWSRKVSSEHRIVYQVTDNAAYFLACRSHYGDK